MKLKDTHWLSEGLSGKQGDLVAYQLYGKTYFRKAPGSYNKVPTQKQAEVRERFKAAHQFAQSVINDPVLKAEYSKKAKNRCSAYIKAVSEFLNKKEDDQGNNALL